MKKAEIYRMERNSGLTFREIADKYGVSKQFVHQMCSESTDSLFRGWLKERCIYVNLRNWMNDNKISKKELLQRLGLEALSGNYKRIGQYLAERLAEVSAELDDWLDKNGIECDGDYTRTGCMIYCEPPVAERCVREDILRK